MISAGKEACTSVRKMIPWLIRLWVFLLALSGVVYLFFSSGEYDICHRLKQLAIGFVVLLPKLWIIHFVGILLNRWINTPTDEETTTHDVHIV